VKKGEKTHPQERFRKDGEDREKETRKKLKMMECTDVRGPPRRRKSMQVSEFRISGGGPLARGGKNREDNTTILCERKRNPEQIDDIEVERKLGCGAPRGIKVI